MGNSTYFRTILKLLKPGFLTSLSSPELHYSVLLLPEAAALGEPANRRETTFLSFTLLTRVSHLALPPVGWHRTVEHPAQTTTVWAWLKTVVILRREFLISGLIITKHQTLPVAAGALDIHEVTVRMLDKSLQLVPPLFFSGKRVQ